MTFSQAYRINAVSAGLTVLSLTGSLGGILGAVMGALTKKRMRRDLRDELEPIKTVAEASE